jgi:hypothetical protein
MAAAGAAHRSSSRGNCRLAMVIGLSFVICPLSGVLGPLSVARR